MEREWDNGNCKNKERGSGKTKKIPTLYERRFEGGKIAEVLPVITPGCEWVEKGEGEATEKVDGAACAIIGGKFYKRYDANPKKGRKQPRDGIPCQPVPDPLTCHWPWWVPVRQQTVADQHFAYAYINSPWITEDGTYEAVGLHFNGNPYGLDDDFLEKHGRIKIKDCPRDFEGIREYLRTHAIEGIVFWRDGVPGCKIKRRDFGFEWPVKEEAIEHEFD